MNPTRADPICGSEATGDTDGDGLNDCEETFLNFDKRRFDTDGDLFPDAFEFYSGTNPGDGDDIFEDLDFDGVNAAEEIRFRSDPLTNDRDIHEKNRYGFQLTRAFSQDSAETCYDFDVDNVSLVRTLGRTDLGPGLNEIVIDFIESPEDDPERVFSLRRKVLKVPSGERQSEIVVNDDEPFELVSKQDLADPGVRR